jgi:Glutamine phosphoribosylpyrophosphate amidotransferase
VHLRVSCPPHRFACHYGIDFPDPEKLIANQMSMEKICEYLNVDSLGYLDIEGMVKATGGPPILFVSLVLTGIIPCPSILRWINSSWKSGSNALALWRRKGTVSRRFSRS